MSKRYYAATKRNRSGQVTTHIWKLDPEKAMSKLSKSYDFITPLDRKPRNVTVREVNE